MNFKARNQEFCYIYNIYIYIYIYIYIKNRWKSVETNNSNHLLSNLELCPLNSGKKKKNFKCFRGYERFGDNQVKDLGN